MAIIINSDLIIYNNCDTKWPTATSTSTSFVKEGLRCNALRVNNTLSSIIWSPDNIVNLNNKYIYIWIRVASKINTLQNGGIRVCAMDTNGGIAEWFVGGSMDYDGQWKCFIVPANRKSDVAYSINYNPSITRNIGVRFYVMEASSSVNCFQDFVCYGKSLIITGNNKETDYLGLQDIADWCRQQSIGILEYRDNAYICFGDMTFVNVTLIDKLFTLNYVFDKNVYPHNLILKQSNVLLNNGIIKGTNSYVSISIDKYSYCEISNCSLSNLLIEYKSLDSSNIKLSSCYAYMSDLRTYITYIDKSLLSGCNNVIDLEHDRKTLSNSKIIDNTVGLILLTTQGGSIDYTLDNIQFFNNSIDISVFNDSTPYNHLDLRLFLKNGSRISSITKNQPSDNIYIIDELANDENVLYIDKISIPSLICILDSSMNEIFVENDFTGIFVQDYENYLNETIQINIYSATAKNNIININLIGGKLNVYLNQENDEVYYNP